MAACVFEAIFNYSSNLRVILQEMAENIEVMKSDTFIWNSFNFVSNFFWKSVVSNRLSHLVFSV